MTRDSSNESITQNIEDDSNEGEEKGGKEVEVRNPTYNDVLLGRGGNKFKHDGNQKLRNISNTHINRYNNVKKSEKSLIAKSIYDQVKAMDPPGRFLKRNSGSRFGWVEVSEETGIEKVSQVLRDLRRQYLPIDHGGRTEMSSSQQVTTMQIQGSPTPWQEQDLSFINHGGGGFPQTSSHLHSDNLRSPPPDAGCNCSPPRLASLNNMECYYSGTVSYNLQCSSCHRYYEGQMTYFNGVADTQSTTVREKHNYSSNNQNQFHQGDSYPPPLPSVPHHRSSNFSGAQMGALETNDIRNLIFNNKRHNEQNAFQDGGGFYHLEDSSSMPKRKFFFNDANRQQSALNSYY